MFIRNFITFSKIQTHPSLNVQCPLSCILFIQVSQEKMLNRIENISEQSSHIKQQKKRNKCLSCEAWEKWALQSQHIILMIEKKLISKENALQSKMKIMHEQLQKQSKELKEKEEKCQKLKIQNKLLKSKQNQQIEQLADGKHSITRKNLSEKLNELTQKNQQKETQSQNVHEENKQHFQTLIQHSEGEQPTTYGKPKEKQQNQMTKILNKNPVSQYRQSKSSNLIEQHILINGQQEYPVPSNKQIQKEQKLYHLNKTGRSQQFAQLKQMNNKEVPQGWTKLLLTKNIEKQQQENQKQLIKGQQDKLKQKNTISNSKKQMTPFEYQNSQILQNKHQKDSKFGLIRTNQKLQGSASKIINMNQEINYEKKGYSQMEKNAESKWAQHRKRQNSKHKKNYAYNYDASYYVEKNKERKNKLGINSTQINQQLMILTEAPHGQPTYFRHSQILSKIEDQQKERYRYCQQEPYEFIELQVNKKYKPTMFSSINSNNQANQLINSFPFSPINTNKFDTCEQEKDKRDNKQEHGLIKQNKAHHYHGSKQLQYKNEQFDNKLFDLKKRIKEIEQKQDTKRERQIENYKEDACGRKKNTKIGSITQNRIQRIRSQQLLNSYGAYQLSECIESGRMKRNNKQKQQENKSEIKTMKKSKIGIDGFNFGEMRKQEQRQEQKLPEQVYGGAESRKIVKSQYPILFSENNSEKGSLRETKIQNSDIKGLNRQPQIQSYIPIINYKLQNTNSVIYSPNYLQNIQQFSNISIKESQLPNENNRITQENHKFSTHNIIQQQQINSEQKQINNNTNHEQNEDDDEICQNMEYCEEIKYRDQQEASLQLSKSSQQSLGKQKQRKNTITKLRQIQRQDEEQLKESKRQTNNNKMMSQMNSNANDKSRKIKNRRSIDKMEKIITEPSNSELNTSKSQMIFKQGSFLGISNFNGNIKINPGIMGCSNETNIIRYKSEVNENEQSLLNKIEHNRKKSYEETDKKYDIQNSNKLNEKKKNSNGDHLLNKADEVPWEHTTLKTVKLRSRQLVDGQKNKMCQGNFDYNCLQRNGKNKQKYCNNKIGQVGQKSLIREVSIGSNPELSRQPLNQDKDIMKQLRKLQFENQNLKSYNVVLLENLSKSKPKKY